jgi:hypothetical protein
MMQIVLRGYYPNPLHLSSVDVFVLDCDEDFSLLVIAHRESLIAIRDQWPEIAQDVAGLEPPAPLALGFLRSLRLIGALHCFSCAVQFVL